MHIAALVSRVLELYEKGPEMNYLNESKIIATIIRVRIKTDNMSYDHYLGILSSGESSPH